jgi:hypothetical protein
MEICRNKASLYDQERTLIYTVTVDDVTESVSGMELESYGVGVTILENGEAEIVPNVTFCKTKVLSLIETLAVHLVTPVTVRDVVEDWLCRDS